MPSSARIPDARSIDPTSPSVDSARVVVWRADEGAPSNLTSLLQRWEGRGWRVRRFEPRILEGPMYGVLLVFERAPHVEERLRRRPIRREVDLEKRPVMGKDAEA